MAQLRKTKTISANPDKWEKWLEKSKESSLSLSQVIEALLDEWYQDNLVVTKSEVVYDVIPGQ